MHNGASPALSGDMTIGPKMFGFGKKKRVEPSLSEKPPKFYSNHAREFYSELQDLVESTETSNDFFKKYDPKTVYRDHLLSFCKEMESISVNEETVLKNIIRNAAFMLLSRSDDSEKGWEEAAKAMHMALHFYDTDQRPWD